MQVESVYLMWGRNNNHIYTVKSRNVVKIKESNFPFEHTTEK